MSTENDPQKPGPVSQSPKVEKGRQWSRADMEDWAEQARDDEEPPFGSDGWEGTDEGDETRSIPGTVTEAAAPIRTVRERILDLPKNDVVDIRLTGLVGGLTPDFVDRLTTAFAGIGTTLRTITTDTCCFRVADSTVQRAKEAAEQAGMPMRGPKLSPCGGWEFPVVRMVEEPARGAAGIEFIRRTDDLVVIQLRHGDDPHKTVAELQEELDAGMAALQGERANSFATHALERLAASFEPKDLFLPDAGIQGHGPPPSRDWWARSGTHGNPTHTGGKKGDKAKRKAAAKARANNRGGKKK